MITYDLSGKTALVTGSNRGIGKAMADALEEAGAKVIRTLSKDCDLSDRKAVYAFVKRIPAGRWGEASDIAGACVFLCSPAAAYVHGAILPVDGGWLAR